MDLEELPIGESPLNVKNASEERKKDRFFEFS